MGVKVAATTTTSNYIQWSQPMKLHTPPSSQTLVASSISSPSSSNRVLSCRYSHRVMEPSSLFGTTPSSKLHRSRSCDPTRLATTTNPIKIRRSCSASFDSFSDQDFSHRVRELSQWFRLSHHDTSSSSNSSNLRDSDSESESENRLGNDGMESRNCFAEESRSIMEPRDWPNFIERKANSIELPISLRMIKRKMQWEDGFKEAEEYAYCSMKKAFSSMVFIIRELHRYTLQMREILFTEDLQGIIRRVQQDIHASFVWLFQQVFSHTPTLMVYTMILLANFTVYSMGSSNIAIAAYPAPIESTSTIEIQDQETEKFSSSALKTYSRFTSNGKSISIGNNNGGDGGKIRRVASGMDGDGWFEQSDQFRTFVPDGASPLGTKREAEAESVSAQVSTEEELSLWNSIVNEVATMNSSLRDECLDHETMQGFVSPIKAEMEPDDYAEFLRTDLAYQTQLSQDPNNPLLLANYAQFLWLVAHDYDRAEDYFKKATGSEGADAEAYSKYASFLWRVKEDLWAAEETFLEAIAADSANSYHAANYAHFLWNTGAEDTCFPLDSPNDNSLRV